MQQGKNDEIEIDLGQIFHILIKKIWIIILALIFSGALALFATQMFVTPLYKSDVKLYVNNSNISLGSVNVGITSSDLSASQSLVETYIVILETRNTLNDVISSANLSYTYSELLDMLSASSVNGTEIFQISVRSEYPEEATLIANTIAEILPIKIGEIVMESTVSVVDFAVTASVPDSPSLQNNAIIGALIGVVVSVALIVIKHLLNQEVTSEEELAMIYDAPVLSVIPDKNHKGEEYYYYDDNKPKKK